MPVIGYFSARSPRTDVPMLAAFHRGLGETGYIEGKNVAIEFRWANGQYDRLPELAADLVQRRVSVIVTSGGPPSALAAKSATGTIPILFVTAGDPVQEGLVASLNRPGGNTTGVTMLFFSLGAKQLGLVHDLVPNALLIGLLTDSNNAAAEPQIDDVAAAARAAGQRLIVSRAGNEREIATALLRSLNSVPRLCSSSAARSFLRKRIILSPWRRAIHYLPCGPDANWSKPGA